MRGLPQVMEKRSKKGYDVRMNSEANKLNRVN